MATPQVAAIFSGIIEREIYRLDKADKIHFIETERLLVCLRSLAEFEENR